MMVAYAAARACVPACVRVNERRCGDAEMR